MTSDIHELSSLKIQIERLRSDLIKCGMQNGLSHPNTVKLSQELDNLLNEYRSRKATHFDVQYNRQHEYS